MLNNNQSAESRVVLAARVTCFPEELCIEHGEHERKKRSPSATRCIFCEPGWLLGLPRPRKAEQTSANISIRWELDGVFGHHASRVPSSLRANSRRFWV